MAEETNFLNNNDYGCTIVDLGRYYRKYYNLVFMTSLESNLLQTPTYIANTQSGYIAQIGLINADSSINNPLTINRLRCVSDINDIIANKEVLLRRITFRAFMPNTNLASTSGTSTPTSGTSPLSARTVTLNSDNTLLSANYAGSIGAGTVGNPTQNIVQTTSAPYGYTEITNWQPNYFRPRVMINNEDIIPDSAVPNLGDMSIGVPLPLIAEPFIPYKEITSINVYAKAGIYNPTTTQIQRVCVYCNLEFQGS